MSCTCVLGSSRGVFSVKCGGGSVSACCLWYQAPVGEVEVPTCGLLAVEKHITCCTASRPVMTHPHRHDIVLFKPPLVHHCR